MNTCKHCGGPMVELFTSTACRDACERTRVSPEPQTPRVPAVLYWGDQAPYTISTPVVRAYVNPEAVDYDIDKTDLWNALCRTTPYGFTSVNDRYTVSCYSDIGVALLRDILDNVEIVGVWYDPNDYWVTDLSEAMLAAASAYAVAKQQKP